ncbi:MAG: Inactivated superfamily helicase [Rhodocyclales bacterium]|nr:Inactivated superfamily helicase [Rhodocyclales bacterium]
MAEINVPFDEGFLERAARIILEQFASNDESDDLSYDLSALRIIVPNLLIAQPLAQSLARVADAPILLPRIDTLSGFVAPWVSTQTPIPQARRQLLLHAGLRTHFQLEESSLWDLAAELIALFDELTEQVVGLPEDANVLLAQIQRAYALRDARPLGVETRMVHTLWRAESQGRPSEAAARILAITQWLAASKGDLCILPEWGSDRILRAVRHAHPEALVLHPRRAISQSVAARTLAAAWPQTEAPPVLRERAAMLADEEVQEFSRRVGLLKADSLEDLASGIAEQVFDWLEQGQHSIALVACDRVAARRVRALLDRRGVLVVDETGWKFSTTRAAATIDALLETLVSDGYHRSLIDLVKSPFVAADLAVETRNAGVLEIERTLARDGIVSGLSHVFNRLVREAPGHVLMSRIIDAARSLPTSGEHAIVIWLDRLQEALRLLGALEALQSDTAGAQWLEWLQMRRAELQDDRSRFRFSAWRAWFNREMDAALFRDRDIDSPVVMTHLAATRLRQFDAVVLIGADSVNLREASGPRWLAHDGVRRELGLPGRDANRMLLREDLAGIMLGSGQCLIAWQDSERDERRLLAPDIEILRQVLAAHPQALRLRHYRRPPVCGDAVPVPMPAPVVPPTRQPTQLSASALRSLLSCPYQYFGRYILALSEVEEITESLEKRDFGELVHAILQSFHSEYPRLLEVEVEDAIAGLRRHSDDIFAKHIGRNFMDQAWRLRWLKRLAAYVDWQRQREQDGWRIVTHEEKCETSIVLDDGREMLLRGRIDRMDRRGESLAVLDYKTQPNKTLREKLADADEVQLAFYGLLKQGEAVEAAFVGLDDEVVADYAQPELAAEVERVDALIRNVFARIGEGEALPAMRPIALCGNCEIRGVCRKDWHADEGGNP